MCGMVDLFLFFTTKQRKCVPIALSASWEFRFCILGQVSSRKLIPSIKLWCCVVYKAKRNRILDRILDWLLDRFLYLLLQPGLDMFQLRYHTLLCPVGPVPVGTVPLGPTLDTMSASPHASSYATCSYAAKCTRPNTP